MSEDYNFYGEEDDSEEVKDINGVTDNVTKYVFTNMEYPCICLNADISLPKHKWITISKLVKQGVTQKNIAFYLLRNGELFKAGGLTGSQIKAFIDIVGLENLFGFYKKDVKLSGDKLYILYQSQV